MNLSLTNRFLIILLGMILAFSLSFTVALADHEDHDHGDDHDEEMMMDGDSGDRIAQLETLIALLTQLVELLSQQAEVSDGHMHTEEDEHDHDTHDHDNEDGLSITVEEHVGDTHIHIYEDGEETSAFYVDSAIDDEDGVIDEIVEETGLDRDDVAAAAEFASKDDEEMHDHEAHHDDGDDMDESHGGMDLEGIHIMGDGSVMLGNGDVLSDATVNDDGMIVLGDGTEVEPEFDLR